MIATAILFNPYLGALGFALVLAVTFWATVGHTWDALTEQEPEPLPDPPSHVRIVPGDVALYDWREE